MNLEKIWQQYEVALKKFIHTKVANEADVEDLLQEVLIKTYRNLSEVKQHSSIKSWLFQIANHTIIDFYRKNSRKIDMPAEELWLSDDVDEVRKAMLQCIKPFIDELSDDDAKLLHAIELENRSQKSYALEQGISYSTLKSRVQKSRRRLRDVFEVCCDFKKDKAGNVYDFIDKRPGGCRSYFESTRANFR